EGMYAAGARVFVEAGPGRVLSGLTSKILGDRPHRVVAVDVAGEPGLHRLLLALAELAVAGVSIDTGPLFAGRAAPVLVPGEQPRKAGWLVDGRLVRTADGRPGVGGLQPADALERLSPAAGAAATRVPANGAADATVLEFLRTTRELVAAQRDVVLG